jgi:SulP family sulfate permease
MHVKNVAPVYAAICCLASSSEGLGVASFRGHASSLLISKIPRGGGIPKLRTATTDAPQDEPEDTPIKSLPNVLTESLSGTTVALTSIPASIAFATIAGVDPLVGIWSSVVLGAVSSVAGLRAGLVAGAAGVVAVPLGKIVRSSGVKYMGPTILLASLMELIFGLAKGGRLINLVR